MRQIVYFSTASGRQDAATTCAISAVSCDFNAREKVTGLLVAGGHRYLQLIEGPVVIVDALMERIRRDQRHVGVTVLVSRRIAARNFAKWSMAGSEEPELGDYATLRQLIDRMRAQVPERELRDQIDSVERRFTTAPPAPIASPWTLATTYEPSLSLDRSH